MPPEFSEEHVIYRYKYLPFTDGALKTIEEGTMKFTCPLDFNDPFDFLPHYDAERIKHVPSIRKDLFKAAGDRRGLSPAQRIQQRPQFVARLRNRILDGTFAHDIMRGVGVVCLSKRPLSTLMWSHYSDFHRGFLLEFRIPVMGTSEDAALSNDRLLPLPVTYTNERPIIYIGEAQPEDMVNKVALTKSLDWDYEAEERVIERIKGPGIFPYRRDDILCSVVAGMRMGKKEYDVLSSLVSSLVKTSLPNLKLYRAFPSKDSYSLEIPGHPRISDGFFEAP